MITKNTIKSIQALKQAKYRKEQQRFIVEGRKSVEELLHSEFETVGLYATERFLQDYPWQDPRLENVTEVQMEQMSCLDTPPGILAVVKMPQKAVEQLPDEPLSIALDGIGNPGNLGTIIRTAEWFGIKNIICSEDCVEVWNPKVIQATMGSVFRVNVVSTDLEKYLDRQSAKGTAVYGALLEGENIFGKTQWTDGVLVIGSESHGIREPLLGKISHSITIPRAEGSITESLNASMATGIILAFWASN